MKLIEKHASGVTFGVSENGKLWLLDNKNHFQHSYLGSQLQTDELEIKTYENQR
jgi:hypothetical protein